jgi:homoserine dehydrogenase
LGYGHVAQAFIPLLASRSAWLDKTYSIKPVICGIGTRSQGYFLHPFGMEITPSTNSDDLLPWFTSTGQLVDNAQTFIQQGKAHGASLLIELTTLNPHDGQPALQHICTALEASMDVITANKGPVAYAQAELQSLAQRQQVQFRFESTVMDGFPLINLAEFTLQAVGMRSFRALLNTTSSYVLQLIEQGHSLDEAILQAQQLGIAEADPWYDLDGLDAAMKTTILANNLLKAQLSPSEVKRTGLRDISLEEIRAASSRGTPIRLVSHASSKNGLITAEVSPRCIDTSDALHIATGTTSVISLNTEAMGTITLVEHEPMVIQTAYGLLSDFITILHQQKQRN